LYNALWKFRKISGLVLAFFLFSSSRVLRSFIHSFVLSFRVPALRRGVLVSTRTGSVIAT